LLIYTTSTFCTQENFVFSSKDTHNSGMKLIDFGCAKLCQDIAAPVNDVAGSPYYVAPEVLDEKYIRTGNTWKASDMWSVGQVV
jgi:calcium-dependent protein kinase